MKNFRTFFMLITVAVLLSIAHTAMAMEGEGTEELPFLITNQAELETIDSFPDCHFKLENDIILEGEWKPLCQDGTSFTGVLDGDGHTISNLTVINQKYCGLFGENSGTIKYLHVVTSDTGISTTSSQTSYAGGIAAINKSNGIIECCSVSGDIYCRKNYSLQYKTNSYAGGIAAVNNGTISKCYTEGNITCDNTASDYTGNAAGIANRQIVNGPLIINCYSNATLSGEITCGIGKNSTNCYYFGLTETLDYPIGDNSTNSFYDKTITGISTTEYGTPKTTTAMKMKKTYTDAGWDFDNIWGIDANINDGYPYLLWEYPQVCSANVEIVGATSTDSTLKFISEVSIDGEPDIATFGTTFIPLWLLETGSTDVATVEYDNSNYNITNNQTYGATLTDIPESCKNMYIVGKSYVKDSNGDYIWSDAKYSSVDAPTLNSIE